MKLFEIATNESLIYMRLNPNKIGKQVYMRRKLVNEKKITVGYRTELIMPLTIKINNKNVYFVLVLRPNHREKLYYGISILTRENAYSNVRLFGKVNCQWLKHFANTNKLLINNNKSQQINNENKVLNINLVHANEFIHYINNPFISIAVLLPLKIPNHI